ncbi:MAG: non-heme iron oxygenase ferredoxin subunit [Acidimicrobiales bacterium]
MRSHEEIRFGRDKLASGQAVRVDGGPYGVCLVRIGDDFYALCDRCSHQNVALSEGEVYEDDATIECWKHGSTFSLADGRPTCLPAVKAVPVYQVRLEGDDVVVTVR